MTLFRSADNSIRLYDRRNLTSNGVGTPVHKFEGHKAAVLCVQVITMDHVLSLPHCLSTRRKIFVLTCIF